MDDSVSVRLTSRDRADDGFAEYHRKVEEQCGRLLPGFQARRDLNLKHWRTLRKAAPAG